MGCYKKIIIILSIICIVLCFSLYSYADSCSPFGYVSNDTSLIDDKYEDFKNSNNFVLICSLSHNHLGASICILFPKFTSKPSVYIDYGTSPYINTSVDCLFVPIINKSFDNNNINFPCLDYANAFLSKSYNMSGYGYDYAFFSSPDISFTTSSPRHLTNMPIMIGDNDFITNSEYINDAYKNFWQLQYIEIKNRLFLHQASKPFVFYKVNYSDFPLSNCTLDIIMQNNNGSTDIVSDYDLSANDYKMPVSDDFFNTCSAIANSSNGDNVLKFQIISNGLAVSTFTLYVTKDDFNGGYNPVVPNEPSFTNANGKTTGTIENGVINATTDYSAVTNSMQETTNAVKDGTTAIQNTLTDNDTNNISNNDLVTDNTQDVTENGFTNIFSTLYNVFTSDNSKDIVLPIPFTGKSFTISKTTLFGDFSQLTWLENLSSVFWYFIISLFIVKDISKRFNKIKSGDIENVVNSNIKEDLL